MLLKTPLLLQNNKSSYLNVFSYIDPGIVSYLNSFNTRDSELGYNIEGYIHARLSYHIYNSVFKSELGYYKPHELDTKNLVRFTTGEIDFIIKTGQKIIPIEVKRTAELSNLNIDLMKNFIKKRKLPFGIVIFGGVPLVDKKEKILYWPYWLV